MNDKNYAPISCAAELPSLYLKPKMFPNLRTLDFLGVKITLSMHRGANHSL